MGTKANELMSMTEDEVRDLAGKLLEFQKSDGARAGVGQITTFNQLGFAGVNDKPDGWYLPDDRNAVAIILETKASKFNLDDPRWTQEIRKNCDIALTKYTHVIGLLYNGEQVRCFKNNEHVPVSNVLQAKEHYFEIFLNQGIDKQKIFNLTARINNCLHSQFGIKNLYHRMIFTACALVAKRYGAFMQSGMDYSTFHNSILSCLRKELIKDKNQNQKLDLLIEVYSEIKMNVNIDPDNVSDNDRLISIVGDFISWVDQISESINSNEWNGEDVMGIFFNEFNRYKAKSESGQVFTPDHITSLMYRVLDVDQNDVVLDAACGSGAFLVKAMSKMTKQAGGTTTRQAKKIKQEQLYGIEFDREIFALACANMLIHKDGKTNLTHADSRTEAASQWIKSRPRRVTKVLMNPPFENKHGCMEIVKNVLNSVPPKTKCAFILPDKKLEKSSAKTKEILSHNRLTDIVKLPENVFFKVGASTSIFVFETGVPQDGRKVFGMSIEDDGLVTVKNQGRNDVYGRWPSMEDYWVDVFQTKNDTRHSTHQWIDPDENLSYQVPRDPFDLTVFKFQKTATDYSMFKHELNRDNFTQYLMDRLLYTSKVSREDSKFLAEFPASIAAPLEKTSSVEQISVSAVSTGPTADLDMNNWREYSLPDIFEISRPVARSEQQYFEGDVPFIASGSLNNGVASYKQPLPNEVLDAGKCITISPVDGYAAYQEKDFLGRGGGGSSMIILRNEFMDENSALFACTVLRELFSDWSYADMGSEMRVRRYTLLLPDGGESQPDWSYMRDFMMAIRQSADQHLGNLKALALG